MNWFKAQTTLGKREKRKIANNTYLIKRGENFAIRLHNTDIITITPDGWILNSGGFRTRTTKQRINDFTNARVYQEKFEWFIGDKPFEDGMFIPFRD